MPSSLDDKTVTAIAAGNDHSLALTSDGKVTAWGYDLYDQGSVPASLADKTVTAISAGYFFNLALTSDGKVTSWGNAHGDNVVPASLDDKTVTAISAGLGHNLALTSDGRMTAWGEDGHGQASPPNSVRGRTVTAISAGYQHSLAVVGTARPARRSLSVRLAKPTVQVRHLQRVTFTRLVAGERVSVRYRGKRLSPRDARANAHGVYRMTFRVGKRPGTRTVRALGKLSNRRGAKTFEVVRR